MPIIIARTAEQYIVTWTTFKWKKVSTARLENSKIHGSVIEHRERKHNNLHLSTLTL